jgi:hypothetical protein
VFDQPVTPDDDGHYFSPAKKGSPVRSTSIASKETVITGFTGEKTKV